MDKLPQLFRYHDVVREATLKTSRLLKKWQSRLLTGCPLGPVQKRGRVFAATYRTATVRERMSRSVLSR